MLLLGVLQQQNVSSSSIVDATCDTTIFTCDNGEEITVNGVATTARDQFDFINDMFTLTYNLIIP